VDLEYTVEEKPSDRLELSGGYGGGRVLVSLGLSFTNFSMRKLFDSKAWTTAAGGRWPDLEPARTDQRPLLPELQHLLHRALARWPQAQLTQPLRLLHSVQTNGALRMMPPPTMAGNPGHLGQRGTWAWASAHLAGRLLLHEPDGQLPAIRLNNWTLALRFTNGTSNVLRATSCALAQLGPSRSPSGSPQGSEHRASP
jgi:hypothetical protein